MSSRPVTRWDIVPRRAGVDELCFKAAPVKDGTGRWMTKDNAKREASRANEIDLHPGDKRWRNTLEHVQRMRGMWRKGWWQEAADRYNESRNHKKETKR